MLIEKIGMPAMLEQTAEEATELSFACLKLAKHLRGENRVHGRTPEEMKSDLIEEAADILVCINELKDSGIIDAEDLSNEVAFKIDRMEKRLKEEEN